jgi:hypothetical protein
MENKEETLTRQQQKAIHVLFRLLADELNLAGLDMKKVLRPEVDIPWTDKSVKEYLWRPVQRIMTGKESTTELCKSNKEIDSIFDVINRHLGEKFGIHVAFPSIEEIMNSTRTYP